MSLPNKISQVVFTVLNGMSTVSTHTLTVSNLNVPFTLVFWEGRTTLGIGGNRRKKNIIRGFDAKLSFTWADVKTQESAIISFINDLKVVTDNDYDLRFNAYGETDYLYVVPESAEYSQDYINQIRRTPTNISFALEELRDDISYD